MVASRPPSERTHPLAPGASARAQARAAAGRRRALIALVGSAATACASSSSGMAPLASSVVAEDAHAPASRVVHRAEGLFGPIFVVDEGDLRVLRFGTPDADDQSAVVRGDPGALPMAYLRAAALGLTPFDSVPERLLLVGIGGGGFINATRALLPELEIDAVDIDPAVVDIARGFFGVEEDEHTRLHIDDGGRFIRRAPETWDVIVLDAYDAKTVPAHLATDAFFASVRARVPAHGVVVLNLGMDSSVELNALVATAAESLGGGCLLVTPPEDENRVLIATPHRGLDRASLIRAAERFEAAHPTGWQLVDIAKTARPCESEG